MKYLLLLSLSIYLSYSIGNNALRIIMVGGTRVFTHDPKDQLELQWHTNFNINNSQLSEIKVMSMNMWGIHTDFDRFKRSIFGKTICEICPICPKCIGRDRVKRMEGAANIIKSGKYDFIMFQVNKNFSYLGLFFLICSN